MNTNSKVRTIAPLVAVAALLAAPAHADVLAGWDFSQYQASASLAPGGASSLSANYSSLDPTGNAGAESAAFGTLHFDGSFGSSNTATDFLPTAGSKNCQRGVEPPSNAPDACANGLGDGPVRSNRKEPWERGETAFGAGAHSVLRREGQTFTNMLGMSASSNLSVVFAIDLTTLGMDASNWAVSFGGRTVTGNGPNGGEVSCDPPGCSSTVGVDFSLDGTTYVPFGSANLTPEDTRFDVTLPAVGTDTAFVRLNLDAGDGTPIIDNVAVSGFPLPEPGVTMQLLAGLVGLLALQRFRSKAG